MLIKTMKKYLLSFSILFFGILRLLAQNPHAEFGDTTPVLTLSHGKFEEFFHNDTVIVIEDFVFDTRKQEVIAFTNELTPDDSLRYHVLLATEDDVNARFLSVDPISAEYPELTPYQFAGNTPIQAIDLDGLEPQLSIFQQNIGKTSLKMINGTVRFGLNRVRYAQGKYDKNYWQPNGDSKLELLTGKKPSDGVNSIINNTCSSQTLDCAQFVQVVRWGAMLETFGSTDFDKKIGEKMTLYSFGSTGIETETTYNRDEINSKFWNSNTLQDVNSNEMELLRQVPVGSRIAVQNFAIDRLMNSKNPTDKAFAEQISSSGWARENMIKVGDDQYAAFGISTQGKSFVSLKEVKEKLLTIYFGNQSRTKEQEKAVFDSIGVSQVEVFKQN
jgi:Protein-glutamine gamma-glutamyltransferase